MDFEMYQVLRWWEAHLLESLCLNVRTIFLCHQFSGLMFVSGRNRSKFIRESGNLFQPVRSEPMILLMGPWNPANSPVEVGSLSHYLYGFSTIPGGFSPDFSHQQYLWFHYFYPQKCLRFQCFFLAKNPKFRPFEFKTWRPRNLDFDLISACYYDMWYINNIYIYIYIYLNVIMYDELS